jgi:HK97 family phage prohead protease
MAIPEKYKHINFKPPSGVRREAEYGLKLRREHGRGGTAVGIARARDLSNGKEVSPSTVRRMKAFFDRHQQNKSAEGFNRGDKGWPSNGKIADLLWGGPSGYSWAKKVVAQMEAADKKAGDSRSLRPFGSTHGMPPRVCVVHGPPGCGKSTHVWSHKKDNDVVFDFDRVMSAISGLPLHQKNKNLISYCMDIRTAILKRALQKNPPAEKTWIITTKVNDELSGMLSDIPTEYIEIEATKDECLKRVNESPEWQPVIEEIKEVIEDYFAGREESRSAVQAGVERRYLGNFAATDRADPSLLRVEKRSDPETGRPRTYLVGYAAVFHRDSLMLGDFIERIDPGAFQIVKDRQDEDGKPLETRCLFNHSPDHLLGRFPTTMRLTVDDKGLRYECLLPESRADVAELVERGDLKGSSFSFVVADGGEEWRTENGQSIRLVRRVKALLDCGPVTYPAYGDASVSVAKRSYEEHMATATKVRRPRRKRSSDVAKRSRDLRRFLAERRGFCKTGEGGGIDNSCGTEGKTKTLEQERNEAAGKTTGGSSAKKEKTKSLEQERLEAAGLWDDKIDPFVSRPYDGGGNGGFAPDSEKEVTLPGTSQKIRINVDDPDHVAQFIELSARASGMTTEEFMRSKRFGGTLKKATPDDKVKLFGGKRDQYVDKASKGKGWGNKEDDEAAKQIGSLLRAANIKGSTLASAVREYAKQSGANPKDEMYSGLATYKQDPREFMVWARKRLDAYFASGRRSDDPAEAAERRDCGRDESGRFGSGNQCQDDEEGGSGDSTEGSSSTKSPAAASGTKPPSKPAKPKYMDISGPMTKAKAKAAQGFIDDARQGQLERGGKDGGKSDDGSGVQTWSKGDDYPWTTKRVGTDEGYIQAQHPDGSKTERYPFSGGDTSEANRLLADELKRKRKDARSLASREISETLRFLRDRRSR